MLPLLLFLLTAWAVTAAGRTVLRGLRVADMTGLERTLFGFALGLGLLAYGMLALGLCHGLYPVAAGLLVAALAALGGQSHADMAADLSGTFRGGVRLSSWGWGTATLFLLLALIALVGVWTPPSLALEWDSLSYHLADPKLYLQAHRIYYVPWESHSNFAFTAEMWYMFGLMLSGVPLAKLFHFACGAGACLATYALGARHLSPRVGVLAALTLASTPLVLWEAGTAYADLAPTFFSALTLLAVLNGVANRDENWLRLGAVLLGLTLSTKATSLTTLVLLALALGAWRLWTRKQSVGRVIGSVAVWCLLALAVGSPWYIKSTAYTGNPVYPFYSKIFPSRYWNASLGAAYDASNANFGVAAERTGSDPHLVRTPSLAALLPWNLTMYLLPGHPPPNPAFRPFNDQQMLTAALSPLLLAALFFGAFGRAAPFAVRALGVYALLSGLLWFATAQYIRYLLPLVPVLCLLAAWALDRALAARWLSGYALAALGICSLLFSFYVGLGLLALEAPVVFGGQAREDYLARNYGADPAMQFINTRLPANAKVVFYGNPFGFYCDKPYLWGDAQHSTFIPYDTLHTADDLRAYLANLGVSHILINRAYFADDSNAPDAPLVYALAAQSGPPVFEAHGVAVYALPGGK